MIKIKNDEILLMQLINKNGNIENLSKQGYNYVQIAEMMERLIQKGYVDITEQGLELNSIGEEILIRYSKDLGRKNSEVLISPQREYLLENRKSIYDIFLPESINELN